MVTTNAETSVKAFPNSPHSPPSPQPEPIGNAVLQVLKEKGNALKKFGECIIFILNRERKSFLWFVNNERGNILTIINLKIVILNFHDARNVRILL